MDAIIQGGSQVHKEELYREEHQHVTKFRKWELDHLLNTLGLCYCKTNYQNLNSFKQHPLINLHSKGQKARGADPLPRVPQAGCARLAGLDSTGAPGEESASKPVHVASSIWFLLEGSPLRGGEFPSHSIPFTFRTTGTFSSTTNWRRFRKLM